MIIGIVGLGLIGGSMAKAYRAYSERTEEDIKIYAYDKNNDVLRLAMDEGITNGALDERSVPACDLILLSLYPSASINYMEHIAPSISTDTLVIDLCGTKREICSAGFALADEYGFTFIGGHPMAGTHNSGYMYSRSNMFKSAPMVLVPHHPEDTCAIERAKSMLLPVGFGHFSVIDACEHDKIIAFTSQLAHVVSNAYVKSPTAREHKGFSAGSYKDLTRVAWLNETMWSELFSENRDNLIFELDSIINSLEQYKQALQSNDTQTLTALLREGRLAKEEIDG